MCLFPENMINFIIILFLWLFLRFIFVSSVIFIILLFVVEPTHSSREGRVFANGLGELGSIPGRVIPKTFKMVLDTSLLNTQQYKVRIEG